MIRLKSRLISEVVNGDNLGRETRCDEVGANNSIGLLKRAISCETRGWRGAYHDGAELSSSSPYTPCSLLRSLCLGL